MKALTKCPKCMGDLKVASEGNANLNEWERRIRSRPKYKARKLRVRKQDGKTLPPLEGVESRVTGHRWHKITNPSQYRVQLQCKRDTCRKVFTWRGRSKSTVLHDMRKDLRRRHEKRVADAK